MFSAKLFNKSEINMKRYICVSLMCFSICTFANDSTKTTNTKLIPKSALWNLLDCDKQIELRNSELKKYKVYFMGHELVKVKSNSKYIDEMEALESVLRSQNNDCSSPYCTGEDITDLEIKKAIEKLKSKELKKILNFLKKNNKAMDNFSSKLNDTINMFYKEDYGNYLKKVEADTVDFFIEWPFPRDKNEMYNTKLPWDFFWYGLYSRNFFENIEENKFAACNYTTTDILTPDSGNGVLGLDALLKLSSLLTKDEDKRLILNEITTRFTDYVWDASGGDAIGTYAEDAYKMLNSICKKSNDKKIQYNSSLEFNRLLKKSIMSKSELRKFLNCKIVETQYMPKRTALEPVKMGADELADELIKLSDEIRTTIPKITDEKVEYKSIIFIFNKNKLTKIDYKPKK